jgi:hypothetical protein
MYTTGQKNATPFQVWTAVVRRNQETRAEHPRLFQQRVC